MRIVCIADTHGPHRQLEVPPADLLIHAGDFTFYSTPPSIVSDFDAWLGSLPHRHKVVVPGNHEFALEEPEDRGATNSQSSPQPAWRTLPRARRESPRRNIKATGVRTRCTSAGRRSP